MRGLDPRIRLNKRRAKSLPFCFPAYLALQLCFAAEKVLQERRYCNVFKLWLICRLKPCRRNEACGGNQHACLKRALDRVPRLVQWQARQDILTATPLNVGGPERAARQCMPRDFYE
jgi:hypothetical protein